MTQSNFIKLSQGLFLIVALSLCFVSGAFAQRTIIDGTSDFQIDASGFDSSPTCNFRVPAATDHVFQQGWYLRVEGDASESAFGFPSSENYNGNTATLNWNDLNGRDFKAEAVIKIRSGAGATSRVQVDLTIENPLASTRNIQIFHLLDLDLKGTASGDSATLVSPNNYIRITDSGTTAEYRGIGADAYLVRAFSGTTDVRSLLGNTVVNNFDSTGLPFGPGDITAGFQFNRTLPSDTSTKITVIFSVNEPANTLTEACAAPNNTCSVLNQPNCDAAGGIYYPGTTCQDSDGDGRADLQDNCPVDPTKFSAGACGCGSAETDSDSDGTPNCVDSCPANANKTSAGVCGCGTADTDSDQDATPDCVDSCPLNAIKTSAGVCGCGTADTDSDKDATLDCVDSCPVNANKTSAGVCGCGLADTDANANGVTDCLIGPELKARLNAASSLLVKVKNGKDGKLTATAKASKANLNALLKDITGFVTANAAGISVSGQKTLSALNKDTKSKITKALKSLSAEDKKSAKNAIKAFLKALPA